MKTATLLPKFLAIVLLPLLTAATTISAATFTVTNSADSGPGSLRQAVLDANAATTADTIVFSSFFDTPRTITLASQIPISSGSAIDTLTITGPGANLLTISGNNAVRHFQTSSGDINSISGMTLANGNNVGSLGTPGGSINTVSRLTLTNVNFTNNTANTGGAIYTTGSGTGNSGVLIVIGCDFTDNSTTGTNINGDGGSAIDCNGGHATITDSLMTGGSTLGGGGAILNSGVMVISESTISNNTSGAVGNSDGGGGISNGGELTLINSTITNNTAGGDTAGGGIRNADRMTIVNSTITGNTATERGGGISARGSGVGGEFVHITNSTISNNVANAGTGSTTFGNAGGIFIGGGMTTTVVGSTISGNTAIAIPGGSETRQGNAGGIFTDGPLTLENSTVSGNVAGNSYGGIQDSNPGGSGDVVTVINSTITNNTAGGNVGGFGSSSVSDFGQQLLRNTIIAGNTASGTSRDVYGSLTTGGHNLIGDTTGATFPGTATGDLYNVDPLLGPLASNGGATQTHALLPGSPAIDNGISPDSITDQRGLPRPFDDGSVPNGADSDASDIGAFENQPSNTVPGNDVTVEAPEGDASATFNAIVQPGFTTFTKIALPSSVGVPPAGYTIVDDAPAYEIETTATFTPPIDVCFSVSGIIDAAEFARLRVLHVEDGQLVDRTDPASLDFASGTVCAVVGSLSPFVIALAPEPGLLNISTRMQVLTDDQVLIGGFIINGTDPKTVILRAVGPSLTDFGVADALADPVLELRAIDGSVIASNDNWTSDRAAIEATGLQPGNDLESAIVATLDPGAYTAIVTGKNGTTGVGLVEAYDLDTVAASELANISTRGFVATESNVMIGGFILGSETNVLIRAIGPALADFGVAGALADPTLELRDVQGALIASNDNWKEPNETEIEATGLQPTKDAESAVFELLPAGAYTAIVAGQGGTTGVALVEVYRLP